jgi:Zn-dependent M28 family amino/carboxypeptidase
MACETNESIVQVCMCCQVLFAWWGAEELGLFGSTHFVLNLDEEELPNFACDLNFDMIGSPNYARMIYNGSQAEESIRDASVIIQGLFGERFKSQGLEYELTDFTGRSDYGPFIANGIPAGGLFTGAEVRKTEEQQKVYGGLANAALDPCYHQACDTYDNVNEVIFEQMAQAAAYTLGFLMGQEDLDQYLNSTSLYF